MANEIENHPRFAVVGHPNKGKSSIVSALSFDDSIQISDTPGTTTKMRSFPLSIDGVVIYELFDTPGFQRARRVLSWLKSHEVTADKRHDVVRAFIHEHRDDERFNDEVELLTPIMDGAGIIYVVDGSKPYGEEYEAEMEILRWTGQPSMALVNLIGERSYIEQWQRALNQYFRMVRQFDPMDSSFSQHISLLESIAQLKEEWIAPLKHSIALFEHHHQQKYTHTAESITQLIYKSLSYIERLKLASDEPLKSDTEQIESKYQHSIRQLEQKSQKQIEHIWSHQNLQKEQRVLLFDDMDLFSSQSASIFGLSRKELMITGAVGGAATGAGVDILLAGSTFFLGSAIGALTGAVGAYWGFGELSEVKVLGRSLGRKQLEIGPMQSIGFPYILLGRALYHANRVADRSHAKRGSIELEMSQTFKTKWLTPDRRKSLEKLHQKFRSDTEVDITQIREYEKLVLECLEMI